MACWHWPGAERVLPTRGTNKNVHLLVLQPLRELQSARPSPTRPVVSQVQGDSLECSAGPREPQGLLSGPSQLSLEHFCGTG